jgi:hypothetical protein
LELDAPNGHENDRFTIYRFDLEPCTFIDGVLSDNASWPNLSAWFADRGDPHGQYPWMRIDKLAELATFIGLSVDQVAVMFCSDEPVKRAYAWRIVGEYHGFHELDSDPLMNVTRDEAARRYELTD